MSRLQLARLQGRYDHLESWVDVRSARSIRWLGFTLEPAAPYGRFGRPLHRFWMRTDGMNKYV